jgi:hypothetical protein
VTMAVDMGVIGGTIVSKTVGIGFTVTVDTCAGVVGVIGTSVDTGVVSGVSEVLIITGFSISGKLNGFPVLSFTAVVEP